MFATYTDIGSVYADIDFDLLCYYCLCRHTACIGVQRFLRQAAEDGDNPAARWGQDRQESDSEEPDPESRLPIPVTSSSTSAPGKTPYIRDLLREWPDDDDDDDSNVIEVLDPLPLAFTFPVQSTSADGGEQMLDAPPLDTSAGQSLPKKRSEAPAAVKKIAKRRKVAAVKPPKQRPMAVG